MLNDTSATRFVQIPTFLLRPDLSEFHMNMRRLRQKHAYDILNIEKKLQSAKKQAYYMLMKTKSKKTDLPSTSTSLCASVKPTSTSLFFTQAPLTSTPTSTNASQVTDLTQSSNNSHLRDLTKRLIVLLMIGEMTLMTVSLENWSMLPATLQTTVRINDTAEETMVVPESDDWEVETGELVNVTMLCLFIFSLFIK
jgi:hypothetical protein